MTANQKQKTIMVLAEEEALRSEISEYLESTGCDVFQSTDCRDALFKFTQVSFDVVIAEARMVETPEIDFTHELGQLSENTILILLPDDPVENGENCVHLSKPSKLQELTGIMEISFSEDNLSHRVSSPAFVRGFPESIDSALAAFKPGSHPSVTGEKSIPSEVESIIRDPRQLSLKKIIKPAFSIETFSHRLGETHLKCRTEIMRDIENILLRNEADIRLLSPQQYAETLMMNFIDRGWINQPLVSDGKFGEKVSLINLCKEDVGLGFGFQSTNIRMDMISFHKACKSGLSKIDVGVFIIETRDSQKYLKSVGNSWTGSGYSQAVRTLQSLKQQMTVPICVIGLGVAVPVIGYKPELPSYACNAAPVPYEDSKIDQDNPKYNLFDMSVSQIKEYVLDFLQVSYDRAIQQNVCLERGKETLELDGLMQLSADVILKIETGRTHSNFCSRICSDTDHDLGQVIRDYQYITQRPAVMRFVLLGDFSSGFIRDLSWRIENAGKSDDAVKIDFQILSFEEIGIRTFEGVEHGYV